MLGNVLYEESNKDKPITIIKTDIYRIKKDLAEIKVLLKELKDIIKPDPIDKLIADLEEVEPVNKGWFW